MVDWPRGRALYFNPRSPCGERPVVRLSPCPAESAFQSTLPVWGATNRHKFTSIKTGNFNPRSPCGERHDIHGLHYAVPDFNPRSPCGERPQRYTNFKVHLWQRGRIFASLREEHRDSRQAAALRDRFFDGNLGANLPAFSVYYGFAVRESRCPPAYSCSCSQNAPLSFHTGCPDSKTAASPFLRP